LNVGEIVCRVKGLMKVLIRDAGNGLYVGSQVPWAANLGEAAEFATLDAAGRKAQEFGGVDAVVVLRYENPESELALNPAYCVTDTPDGGRRLRT
jgi:hypothetical protein